MSKLKAGDVTMWATTTLMDLVGPYAWSTECPLEKWFRDAKIYQLFEGTAEIQRMVISRMQAREYAERLGFGAEVAAEAMTTSRSPAKEPVPPDASKPRGVHDHGMRTRWKRGAPTAAGGCGSRWRSTSPCSRSRSSAASSPARWRCSPTPGHLLSDVGSIGLALFAAAARLAARRRPAHLRLPALRGAGGAGQRPAAGRGRDRRRDRRDRPLSRPARDRRAAASSPSACSASPATSPPPLVLAGGEREDLNLEGVLRHSFADALGSLGVVVAGAFVLAGGSPIVDPIVGLLIAALSWPPPGG